jgi:hypothetical protein
MIMKKNMGKVDKTLRLIVGLILISLVFIGPQTPWGWIGLILVVTSFVGWCPLYVPFKWSTIKGEK